MKIQHIKRIILVIALFTVFYEMKSQKGDLFSLENSKKYANHLFLRGEYQLSFNEYKRLCFLDSTNTFFQTRLLQSSYRGKMYKKGIEQARFLYPSDSLFPKTVAREYTYLLLNTEYTWRTQSFINSTKTFSQENKLFYSLSNLMLDFQMDSARSMHVNNYRNMNSLKIDNLNTILIQAETFKPKSKLLAGTLSAIVPGSGKVYSGNVRDGIFSFLYTSLSGYQAYRGFKDKGINSIYGWVFGSISTGFYLGNVYGSVKAITTRINRHREDLIQQTRNVVASSY